MRKRKEDKQQDVSNLTKKVKKDETNKGTRRGTIKQLFSTPSQLGYLPENISLSQTNNRTMLEYAYFQVQQITSSSSYDNPDGYIPRSDNPGSATYLAPPRSANPSDLSRNMTIPTRFMLDVRTTQNTRHNG
eukprot:14917318-Heterocapsa_arctica.AAC.1